MCPALWVVSLLDHEASLNRCLRPWTGLLVHPQPPFGGRSCPTPPGHMPNLRRASEAGSCRPSPLVILRATSSAMGHETSTPVSPIGAQAAGAPVDARPRPLVWRSRIDGPSLEFAKSSWSSRAPSPPCRLDSQEGQDRPVPLDPCHSADELVSRHAAIITAEVVPDLGEQAPQGGSSLRRDQAPACSSNSSTRP